MQRAAAAVALLLVLLAGAVPLGFAFAAGFRDESGATMAHFQAALLDPLRWRVLGWTALVAAGGAAGAVALGVPFALLTARTRLPGGRLLSALYAAPLVLPPLLSAIAFDSLLAGSWRPGAGPGRLGTAAAASALFAISYFPLVAIFARRSLLAPGASLEEAASLAVGPWPAFRRVTLPLARPGIALGALLAFVFAFNDFSLVDYLNLVFSQQASQQVLVYPWLLQIAYSRVEIGGEAELLALGVAAAVPPLVALAAALRLASRAAPTVGAAWRPPAPLPLSPAARWAGSAACFLLVGAGTLLPLGHLLATAGGAETYREAFGPGRGAEALRLTVGTSAAAALLATACAVVLADASRTASAGARTALAALAMLPLACAPALLSIGAGEAWNRPWLTFTRGDAPWNPVYGTAVLPALVLFARVLPFALAASWSSLREVEPSQVEAAEVAGIPWDLRMRRIVLPLARPGVVLGALLAFVFAARELDALAVLQENQTLLHKLWGDMHYGRTRTVAAQAVGLVALLASAFALAAASGLLRPGRGAPGDQPRGGAPAASARRSSSSP
jgi:iron(III) transport system permease protein